MESILKGRNSSGTVSAGCSADMLLANGILPGCLFKRSHGVNYPGHLNHSSGTCAGTECQPQPQSMYLVFLTALLCSACILKDL